VVGGRRWVVKWSEVVVPQPGDGVGRRVFCRREGQISARLLDCGGRVFVRAESRAGRARGEEASKTRWFARVAEARRRD
jgi:hypothetical protein